MKIGTRSLLFGAHQILIHPLFLAVAWVQLYGIPPLREWWPLLCAFVVHDWGYWGKPNMDGPAGRWHPETGGQIMDHFFGREWGDFTRYHSRWLAARNGREPSPLCAADKLVFVITPSWIYLPLVHLSGEVVEYRARYAAWIGVDQVSTQAWYTGLRQDWTQEVCRLAPDSHFACKRWRRRAR